MNAGNVAAREAVKRIKEAIYDVQIGEAEITSSRHNVGTYVVKFDSRAGNAAAVTVHASQGYDMIVEMLTYAHEN